MYTENDLVRIAKRENNNKRGYLVVNPLQGKHVPVSPSKSLALFSALAQEIKIENSETVLVVGFAETATAIGAHIALSLKTSYIQTTREVIPDVEYIYFSEAHSHATEQKLVKNDMDIAMKKIRKIIFVEDEVTTGNTIMNIISILKKMYSEKLEFSVLSLINGMDKEAEKMYKNMDISLHYLVKTNHSTYEDIVKSYQKRGSYFKAKMKKVSFEMHSVAGKTDLRRLCESDVYRSSVNILSESIIEKIEISPTDKVLVLGTEETMYPALYVGSKIEELGCVVKSHSTTRSPIEVFCEDDYPLNKRYEIKSPYDLERTTFVYNLTHYDKIIVITDAEMANMEGMASLVNVLEPMSPDIRIFKWESK